MALRVPFHLLRRDEAAAAVGLLLETDDPAALLSACARLGDPLVFPVAGGFLIVAESVQFTGHAVRLRRLSENCYLPADADLVPAISSAEAVDLTANRGLVFLPNRAPLAFDPHRPLKPAAFLAIPKPVRDEWEPFPDGPPLAERLLAITRILPEPPIDELLAGDGPPIGTDDARPPQTGIGKRALGTMSAGLGTGIGALGKAIGSKKLGTLGDKLKAAGTQMSPRLSEDLLGRQEAALQHLLKKFREGKTDDALRRAIPVRSEPSRGSQIYGSSQLPTQGWSWSFASLFSGGGRSSIWAGGNPDTWRDLIAEYHKAAREAASQGDFRRAALIYAKLLSDFRSAAEVLARGGLHREAGILFRDKVKHTDQAAREFEMAGDHDEALRLYREAHLHVEAGDLLRRIGEEELALAEYLKAADRVVQLRQDHVEAGDILLRKTGRADLAGAYFARGWQSRSKSLALSRNASACAERLIEIYAFATPRDAFWTLLAEAEDWLKEPGWSHDSGRFFNRVAGLAELPHLRDDRAEIRDRCRLGLANKLREHATYETNAGTVVSDLFGSQSRWSPAVVSDADHALRAWIKQQPRVERPATRAVTVTSLHSATPTAAVQAADVGDLFVGFRDGAVARYDPANHLVRWVHSDTGHPIIGLAVDDGADWVAMLIDELAMSPTEQFRSFVLELTERLGPEFSIRARTRWLQHPEHLLGLLPVIDRHHPQRHVGINTANGVGWHSLPDLTIVAETGSRPSLPPTIHLQLYIPDPSGGHSTFTFQGGSVSWGGNKVHIGWMPDPAPGSTLYSPPVAWLVASHSAVYLAGLFDNAHLYSSCITRHADGTLTNRTLTFAAPGGFRAAAIWESGKVIGVSSTNRLLWLRVSGPRFAEWAPATNLSTVARAVACFPSRRTGEVLVVLEDGNLARIPVPS